MTSVLERLMTNAPGLLVLLDPGRTDPPDAARVARVAEEAGVAGLLIGSSFDGISSLPARRQFPNVLGKVGKDLANLPNGVILVFCKIVDGAGDLGMHVRAAQLSLIDVPAKGSAHDWRTAGEKNTALGHNAEVTEHSSPGSTARSSTEYRRDHGNLSEQLIGALPTYRTD